MRGILIKEYGPIESHSVAELPEPDLAAGHVLIDNRAVGLNYPDALMLMGRYQKRPAPPFVPGRDCAGVVRAVGAGVTRCKPGDRVAAQVFSGAFAEVVAAPEKRCFVMPDAMPFEEGAAMLTVFNTAYVACVLRAQVRAGEVGVVTGAAGGVGLASVQLLAAHGATVIAAVSSEDKAKRARANGAAHVIRTEVDDLKEHFKREVTAITGVEKGCNIAIDTVGGEAFEACTRVLAFEGRLAIVGFAGGEIPAAQAHYLLYNNLSVMGAPLDVHFEHRYERMDQGVKDLFRFYEQGKVRGNVTRTFPLESFAEGFRSILDRRVLGKIVLTF